MQLLKRLSVQVDIFMIVTVRTLWAKLVFLLPLFTVLYTTASAQERSQQFSVQHDNDFIFGIDRYYTAGTFLQYDRQLKSHFLFKRSELYPVQLQLRLGQETYTPRELFETNFEFLERPYAGYSFISGQLSQATAHYLLQVRGEIGLAGEQSLAGTFQVAYHELINEFIPVWAGEIGNSIHLNAYGAFIKDFEIPNSNLFKNFALQSELAYGSRFIYARQEAILFLGNRDALGSSSSFGRLGDQEEFYGFIGGGAEYVFLNALIQGNPLGDDSPFTLPSTDFVFSLKAGARYRGLKNTYSAIYKFRTRETEREGRSQFVSLIFARRF